MQVNDRVPENEKIVILPEEIAASTPKMVRQAPRIGKDAWFAGGSIGIVTLVLLVGGLVVVNLPSKPNATPSDLSIEADATLSYWTSLGSIGSSLNNDTSDARGSSTLGQKSQQFRTAAEQISRLPVLNVDKDAVEIGSKMVELLGESELVFAAMEKLVDDANEFGNRSTSGEKMVESFVRGFLGDPFGVHQEMLAEQGKLGDRHQRLLDQFEAVQRKSNELRAATNRARSALTTRYRIEFDVIE